MKFRQLCYALLFLLIPSADACLRVTPPEPGMPATICKTCAENLITVTQMAPDSKKMDRDVVSMTGACSERTFTCKGIMASIQVFGSGGQDIGNIADGDDGNVDGTSTFTVTCNGAGRAWENGGMVITRVECSAIPPCKNCDPNSPAVTQAAPNPKDMEVGDIVSTGACSTRTFTCTGLMASIAVKSMDGQVTAINAGANQIATITVECNADGTGWTSGGKVITELQCSATPPCKTCAANSPAVTPAVTNPKDMEVGDIVSTGACSTRTFTCTGLMASIAVKSMDGQVTAINAGANQIATITVECNADGTGWTSGGKVITELQCSATPPCKNCDPNSPAVTQAAPNPKDMEVGDIVSTGACSTRTFTCTGLMASIAVKSMDGQVTAINAGANQIATITVECNADGTGWTSGGKVITELQCSATPPCKTCAANSPAVTPAVTNPKQMEVGDIVSTGACSTRTFTCTGLMASIAVKSMDGQVTAINAGANQIATITVECNADGTGWTAGGKVITELQCSATPPCKTCAANSPAVTPAATNPKQMEVGDIVSTGACSTRTFTCTGLIASIAVKSMDGQVTAINAGANQIATITVECNADGTGWTAGGKVITELQCSATPPCKTCAANSPAVTPAVTNPKQMEVGDIVSTGACSTRTFTCTGLMASIAVKSMDGQVTAINGGANQIATITVECNADGTGWTAGGKVITELQCSATPPCKTCAANSPAVTPAATNPKQMEVGDIVSTGACSTRTFTCTGLIASIAVKSMDGQVTAINAGANQIATITVECNADGTGWTAGGKVITELQCSATPPCKTCAANSPAVTPAVTNPKQMEVGDIVSTGACSTRTFTCTGLMASIAVKSMDGQVTAINAGANQIATITVECNADGTGWTAGGKVITELQCSATPPCKTCAANSPAVTPAATNPKQMEVGDIVSTGACSTRTFTCTGLMASIAVKSMDGQVTAINAGANQIATITVECNADGTGWTAGGKVITELQCSATPPCKTCAANSPAVTPAATNPKQMEVGDIVSTGACSTRTFTCTGLMASIAVKSMDGQVTAINGGANQIATITVECNADGTGWTAGGKVITELQCSATPPCKTCAANSPAVTPAATNPKQMEVGDIVSTGACSTRTFTCTGLMASIAVKSMDGQVTAINAGANQIATITVECNADGTGWTAGGKVITELQCSATPPCKTCAANSPAVTPAATNPKQMEVGDIVSTGACSTRTFTCTGLMASIAVKSMDGQVTAINGGANQIATITVECNADGTGWTAGGKVITELQCSATPPCKTCAATLLKPTMIEAGVVTGGTVVMADPCYTMVFTCNGIMASFAVKSGNNQLAPIMDGGTRISNLKLTCNTAGTAWRNDAGMDITEAVCSATPPCQTCTLGTLDVTESLGNARMTEMYITTGACHMRVFTCTGEGAKLEFYNGLMSIGVIGDGGTGVAMFPLDCNDEGTGWGAGGQLVTRIDCYALPPVG